MWRLLLSVPIVLLGFGKVQAQSVVLAEAPLAQSCFRNDLSMTLTGKISVQQEGKTIALKQTASARHEFLERILEAKETLGEKSARIYQLAEASIAIDSDLTRLSFRPEHSLFISQRSHHHLLTYATKGLLSDEEKELTEHFDTLALPGLLPGKETTVGQSWTIATDVVLSLCDLDGLISGHLTGKLVDVKGEIATGTIEGIMQGIGMGAQVTMEVKARFAFHGKEKRIIALEWQQHDERLQGPVNPALSADATYKLKRTPILEPNELSEIALVRALSIPAEKMSPLLFRDAKGRFEFQHARAWHLVGQEEKHVVFRLLSERGDFVAQVTLTPFTRETPGQMMEIDDFVRLMAEAPSWEQADDLLEKNAKVEVSGESALKVYRVGASGKLGGVPAIQYFHLLSGPRGDQLIVTFTMDPKQAPNLSPHDLTLIRSITFPQGQTSVSKRE